jgi:hypothetical protein
LIPFSFPFFHFRFFLYLFSSFPPTSSLALQNTDHDSTFRGSSLAQSVQIVRKSDATRPQSCFIMSRAETTKQAIKTGPYWFLSVSSWLCLPQCLLNISRFVDFFVRIECVMWNTSINIRLLTSQIIQQISIKFNLGNST